MTSLTRTVKSFKKQANLDFKASLLKQNLFSTWQRHGFFILGILICYFFLDRPIAEYFHQYAAFLSPLDVMSHLGGAGKYIALFLSLAVIAKLRGQNSWVVRYVFLICWIAAIYSICGVMKTVLGRVRPEGWLSEHLFGFFGFSLSNLYHSFPSGHTTIWVSLACGFGLFFPKFFRFFLSIALLAASTRIVLTHHYVSDVLGTTYFICVVWSYLLSQLQKERA